MSFSMPSTEQARAATAEGVAGSAQHVEHVTSVGPWTLRRDSSSSWTAVSSPETTRTGTRRGTISTLCGEGASAAIPDVPGEINPFSDAFGASVEADESFHMRNASEGSGSTIAVSPTEGPGSVDKGEELLKGRRENSPAPEQPVATTNEPPAPPASITTTIVTGSTDIERQAGTGGAQAQAQVGNCRTCKEHAPTARVGLQFLVLNALLLGVSPIISLVVEKSQPKEFKERTVMVFVETWTAPFFGVAGTFLVAYLVLQALATPRTFQLTSPRSLFAIWLGTTVGVFGVVVLCVAMVHELD